MVGTLIWLEQEKTLSPVVGERAVAVETCFSRRPRHQPEPGC